MSNVRRFVVLLYSAAMCVVGCGTSEGDRGGDEAVLGSDLFCSQWMGASRVFSDGGAAVSDGELVLALGEIAGYLPVGEEPVRAVLISVETDNAGGSVLAGGTKVGVCGSVKAEDIASRHAVGDRGVFVFHTNRLVDGSESDCGDVLAGVLVDGVPVGSDITPWFSAVGKVAADSERFQLESIDTAAPEAGRTLELTWSQLSDVVAAIGYPEVTPADTPDPDWRETCLSGLAQNAVGVVLPADCMIEGTEVVCGEE